ncbi:hypothetical protein ACFYXQ_30810 [Nocardia jiangxiensis]|uniref:Uncharacterized protein n=1 Tax=Nocardia jiangxiensis TaxID=282685 RepID=A0ABW6SAI7_9NOCA
MSALVGEEIPDDSFEKVEHQDASRSAVDWTDRPTNREVGIVIDPVGTWQPVGGDAR